LVLLFLGDAHPGAVLQAPVKIQTFFVQQGGDSRAGGVSTSAHVQPCTGIDTVEAAFGILREIWVKIHNRFSFAEQIRFYPAKRQGLEGFIALVLGDPYPRIVRHTPVES
jgi:hypothetical protein